MIEVNNIYYKYYETDNRYALKDVSFQVQKGEWLSIVGHNGSGKSTSVRLIAGLLVPESGTIAIDGEVLTEENIWQKRQQMGLVFQNPDNQFVGATVEDDVVFGLENAGLSLDDMRQRVIEALDMVGMSAFKEREPARLSGGQKQRVALAGVIALRPSLLILDEATSMLDPEGRLELIARVRDIKERYGMTVMSISHDLDEVALSDRVLVMKDGQVESSSRPADLFLREDLQELGLQTPFSVSLADQLRQAGLELPAQYFSEEALEEIVWESISKK